MLHLPGLFHRLYFTNFYLNNYTTSGYGGINIFVAQIAALAVSPHDVYEQIGIGFWGGLILIVTGITAYKAATGEAPLYVL